MSYVWKEKVKDYYNFPVPQPIFFVGHCTEEYVIKIFQETLSTNTRAAAAAISVTFVTVRNIYVKKVISPCKEFYANAMDTFFLECVESDLDFAKDKEQTPVSLLNNMYEWVPLYSKRYF